MSRQFQLRTLLIAVALCALGTWWENWPRQTAQWFMTEGYKSIPTGAEEDEDDGEPWERSSFRRMIDRAPSEVVVTPQDRTLSDLLLGRQTFFITGDGGPYLVDIVRGRVRSVRYWETLGGGGF